METGDVTFLMRFLHNYSYKWNDIGLVLGFHYGELKGIEQQSPKSDLLREVLNRWSEWPDEDHSGVPTMEKLRDALRSGTVGLGALANKLYEQRDSLPSKQK